MSHSDTKGAAARPRTWRRGLFGLVAAAATVFAGAGQAMPVVKTRLAQQAWLRSHMLDTTRLKPRLLTKPPHAVMGALRSKHAIPTVGAGTTVPYWSTTIKSPLDNITYNVSMVGSSPYDPTPHNTNVTYVPVVIRIHLGGFVIDPTAVSNCDSQSAARRFFNSPIFRPITGIMSNGVNVSSMAGGAQLLSAYQRANFWNAVKGTTYGVTLVPSQLTPIIVDWSPTNPQDFVAGISDNCGGVVPAPVVDIDEFDLELQAIAAAYAKPNQIPISLALDTVIYVGDPSQCCVLGYHNAIPVAAGTQLYAVGAYFDTNNAFGPHFADITVWVHELGELIDDPFVQSIPGVPGGFNNDLTPAWGHTGQVSGCQNNLENGDPLTPDQAGSFANYPITGVGGFVYHYQDLAFHDWFYRTPSTSTGGKGSFVGNFPGGGQPTICS